MPQRAGLDGLNASLPVGWKQTPCLFFMNPALHLVAHFPILVQVASMFWSVLDCGREHLVCNAPHLLTLFSAIHTPVWCSSLPVALSG